MVQPELRLNDITNLNGTTLPPSTPPNEPLPPLPSATLFRPYRYTVNCWVFHDANDGECPSSLVVTTLQTHGYLPFLDSLHRNDRDWLISKFRDTPHRFLSFGPCPASWTAEEWEDEEIPDCVIYYNESVFLSEMDWARITEFFFSMMRVVQMGGLPYTPVWTRFLSKYCRPPPKAEAINSLPPPLPAPTVL